MSRGDTPWTLLTVKKNKPGITSAHAEQEHALLAAYVAARHIRSNGKVADPTLSQHSLSPMNSIPLFCSLVCTYH